jgi:hypothetical protein
MIRYALRCARGHQFESWFKSSAAYDSQRKRGLVACPACNSTKVEKAIMAPRIAAKGKKPAPEPAPAPAAETPTPLMMAPQERELAAKLKELRDHVLKTADNVGRKFPDEARKMHYGDIEHRAIYGEATTEEARALIDEGVEVAPLPVFPDDRN